VRRDRSHLLAAATLIFVALNLRMTIAALAPVLTQIQRETGLTSAASGLLAAVPVLCFGLVAPSTPALRRRFGMGSLLGLTMAVVAVGAAIRLAPSLVALFLGTAVIGAGIAVANVVLPGLIKRDFHREQGLMIALYAVSLYVGAAFPAGLTVPIEDATGLGWRPAVALWGIVAVVALLAWMPRARSGAEGAPGSGDDSPYRELLRDRLAWAVTLCVGLQAFGYYALLSWLPAILESHGMGTGAAGWMLSYSMFPGMAASLATPVLARRLEWAGLLIVPAVALCVLAYVGLAAAPTAAPYVWVTALGLGQGAALALSLGYIVARARDDHHVAHLATMSQSIGYLLAATGPFLLGAIHGLTDDWTVPLLVLLGSLVPLCLAGLVAGRGGHVLDRAGGAEQVVEAKAMAR
jgi:MFS transporter, CP family, cyanate transporter